MALLAIPISTAPLLSCRLPAAAGRLLLFCRSLDPHAASSCSRRTNQPLTAHSHGGNNGRPIDTFLQEFSVLPQEIPWDGVDVLATMALYIFSVHIPISFGGLGVVSMMLHQPELEPLTEALSILLLQATEFLGVLAFLQYVTKQKNPLPSIFRSSGTPESRSWIKASVVAFGLLFSFVLLTSFLANQLAGPKDVDDPTLRSLMRSGPTARAVSILVDCFMTPLLEETVYRGFLLRSLASTWKWQQAVLVSSLVFSLAHLQLENAPQLFVIGYVLGCVYCWTGNLSSPIVVHSVYNATILLATWLS